MESRREGEREGKEEKGRATQGKYVVRGNIESKRKDLGRDR